MKRQWTIAIVLTALMATSAVWAVNVQVEAKTAGSLSLGIYDAQDHLLRTLISGRKVEAGVFEIEWDGKDDLGRDLPLGQYTVKGLVANLGWEYQLMMGNAGQPPYLNSDGTGGWGGVWGHVLDAATDSTGKNVYLLWTMEEGTPALIKVDPAGGVNKFKLWGAHNSWSWGNCQALATDGEYVYIGNNCDGSDPGQTPGKETTKALIWRVRADSGEFANNWPGAGLNPLTISEISKDALPSLAPSWEMYDHPTRRRSRGFGLNLFGLAVDENYIYCTLRAEGKLVILDKTTGARIKEVTIANAGGLAMAPDGNLYVLSGRGLIKVSPAGAVLGPVIQRGLMAPYDLCVDTKGNLWISDQGAAMQVKVFSPTGQLLQTIGKREGRPLGGEWAKMKGDLLYPTGPAVTADGTLYVGEECAPKRVAIFKDGQWADEWIGPLASGCAKVDIADEADPSDVYQFYYPDDLVRYRVDYANKTHVLDAVWGYFGVAQGRVKEDSIYGSGRSGGQIRHLDGKTFLCSYGSFYRVEGYNLTPCANLGWGFAQDPNWMWASALARLAPAWKTTPANLGQYPSGPQWVAFHTWRDRNGDWEAQEEEMDWDTPPGNDNERFSERLSGLRPYVDDKMNVYAWGYKIPCQGLDTAGNPIYSWSQAEALSLRPMGVLDDPSAANWENTSASNVPYDAPLDLPGGMPPYGREISCMPDPDDGGIYWEADYEGKGKGLGWASSGIFARLGKTDKQGNWVWMASSKALAFAKPGQFYKPGEIAGIVKGLLFVTDWNGQMRVWDKDTGLYAGSLFADGYKGPMPNENLVAVEYNEAHAFLNRLNGQVYATAGDGEGMKIFRVNGVEEVERFTSPVTLGAAGQAALPRRRSSRRRAGRSASYPPVTTTT